jgi:hypothetical protein
MLSPQPPAHELLYTSPIPPKQRLFSRQTSEPRQQAERSASGLHGMRPMELVPSGQRQSTDVRRAEASWRKRETRMVKNRTALGKESKVFFEHVAIMIYARPRNSNRTTAAKWSANERICVPGRERGWICPHCKKENNGFSL